jgi:hypothetical protein
VDNTAAFTWQKTNYNSRQATELKKIDKGYLRTNKTLLDRY